LYPYLDIAVLTAYWYRIHISILWCLLISNPHFDIVVLTAYWYRIHISITWCLLLIDIVSKFRYCGVYCLSISYPHFDIAALAAYWYRILISILRCLLLINIVSTFRYCGSVLYEPAMLSCDTVEFRTRNLLLLYRLIYIKYSTILFTVYVEFSSNMMMRYRPISNLHCKRVSFTEMNVSLSTV
jgi:hypothetical protein